MSISNLERAMHAANEWLNELAAHPGIDTQPHAYTALRAVLLTFRDRLTVEEAAHVAAQLPLIVRGIFFEGWRPAHVPVRGETPDQFLNQIAEGLPRHMDIPPELALRAVMSLLSHRISQGELKHVRAVLPRELLPLCAPSGAW